MSSTTSADFKNAMRRIPAAVAVVSTGFGDRRRGLTATAICSVSADPPQILACVNKNVSAHETILGSQRFAVNFLSDQHEGVARAFATPTPNPDDRFACAQWEEGELRVPLLVNALASFECRVAQTVDCGTHTIYIGLIENVRLDGASPLLYQQGEFRNA